jgi:hypothetical protein
VSILETWLVPLEGDDGTWYGGLCGYCGRWRLQGDELICKVMDCCIRYACIEVP